MRDDLLKICWTLLFLLIAVSAAGGESCGVCHRTQVRGAHAKLACSDCHRPGGAFLTPSASPGAAGCLRCHAAAGGVLHGSMATREAEKRFASQAFGRFDSRFFEKNCTGCHISDCLDCHGGDGHDISPPQKEDCHACHRGYFVGADYWGLAPREDHLRYQRGKSYGGEHYLKMRPDVHAEAGMGCGDCHTMASLAGKGRAKGCLDCHHPDPKVIEHSIAPHMTKMECWACHAAWAPQEYGSFFLRMGDSPLRETFRVKGGDGEYVRSAYLKSQDAPPLGRNRDGKVEPIRPQFIAYYSDLRPDGRRVENVLASASWKPFFPHTVRRGTPPCDACHDNPRRFLLEPEKVRIYRPDEDGMGVKSFWDRRGQRVEGGTFLAPEEVARLGRRSPEYRRAYVEKWKNFVQRVEPSSGR